MGKIVLSWSGRGRKDIVCAQDCKCLVHSHENFPMPLPPLVLVDSESRMVGCLEGSVPLLCPDAGLWVPRLVSHRSVGCVPECYKSFAWLKALASIFQHSYRFYKDFSVKTRFPSGGCAFQTVVRAAFLWIWPPRKESRQVSFRRRVGWLSGPNQRLWKFFYRKTQFIFL